MTHYDILGIKQTATDDEIKQAYRNMIATYHPAFYQGDTSYAEQRTEEITRAYKVLSSPGVKKDYDLFNNDSMGSCVDGINESGDVDAGADAHHASSNFTRTARKSKCPLFAPALVFMILLMYVMFLPNADIARSQKFVPPPLNTNNVYWVDNGKSFHSTSKCPTLSRSSGVYKGPPSDARAVGIGDPCNICIPPSTTSQNSNQGIWEWIKNIVFFGIGYFFGTLAFAQFFIATNFVIPLSNELRKNNILKTNFPNKTMYFRMFKWALMLSAIAILVSVYTFRLYWLGLGYVFALVLTSLTPRRTQDNMEAYMNDCSPSIDFDAVPRERFINIIDYYSGL